MDKSGFGDPTTEVTPAARKLWQAEVRRLIALMAQDQQPYLHNTAGIELMILPQVFSPAHFTDSEWFALEVAGIVGTSSLLDIGTGTGIVALAAALAGARVTATDLNPHAVENARLNFQRQGLQATVLEGDIYEPLPTDARFDVIFWNHPFNRGTNPNEDPLSLCGFDFDYHGLTRFIREAHRHLAPNGRLLLGTGTFAELGFIEETAAAAGYRVKVLKRRQTPLQHGGEVVTELRICELGPPETA